MPTKSNSRFRHEDVASVPKGWRVRTVKHEKHRVRVAFPPGRKQHGSGRLVSVLHPAGENPCTLRSTNPAELLVMGANPPRTRGSFHYRVVAVERHGSGALVQNFDTKDEARKFSGRVDRVKYFRPTVQKLRGGASENPAELLVMGANPRVEIVHADNPPAEAICEDFTGAECSEVEILNEPHMPRGRYAALGPLLALYVKPARGGAVLRIGAPESADADPKKYWNGQLPLVVSDTSARQMYFVGGNQDISGMLVQFGALDRGNGIYELGGGRRIDYQCKKVHVADPDEDQWKHKFGEENGELPTVLFDSCSKRILLEGGDYRIDGAWIRN